MARVTELVGMMDEALGDIDNSDSNNVTLNIDYNVSEVTNILRESAVTAGMDKVRKGKKKSKRINKPWFNQEYKDARKQNYESRNVYRNTHSQEDLAKVKVLGKSYKKEVLNNSIYTTRNFIQKLEFEI